MARKNCYQCPEGLADQCERDFGPDGYPPCADNVESAPSASHNSAMDAIAALADKWCDATNQPDSICVALYQFTTWARQQHQ